MKNKMQVIPAVGLLCTVAVVGYMVVQLNAQSTAPSGDLTQASIAEVRDAQGQVVLRGQFAVAEEEDDDIERKATLTQTGVDTDAAGEASEDGRSARLGRPFLYQRIVSSQRRSVDSLLLCGVRSGHERSACC